MKTERDQRRRLAEKNSLLEKMVEHAEPVLIGVGIAFVVVVVTLLVSLTHKLS